MLATQHTPAQHTLIYRAIQIQTIQGIKPTPGVNSLSVSISLGTISQVRLYVELNVFI